MHFCFKLIFCVVLAGGLWAADSGTASGRMTSVVRVDAKTGKLVRSVVVAPKPVNQQRVAETRVVETVVAPRVMRR